MSARSVSQREWQAGDARRPQEGVAARRVRRSELALVQRYLAQLRDRPVDFLESRAAMTIDATLQRLSRQPFRAGFHLRGREAAAVELRGMDAVRGHAEDLLARRLAPAAPYKDGKQTPYRGHPVFVAQHATATCCRTCLERWHGIPKGRELTSEEQAYAVDVICRWIETDLAASGRRAPR
jgi:hypothetical protein